MDNNNYNNSIYDGPQQGLFGQTDRASGEYHFRSGNVQRIYSDARYIPADESFTPKRYYRPASAGSHARKKAGLGFFAILSLCLACAILGGVAGASVMSGYLDQRLTNLEDSMPSAGMSGEAGGYFPEESEEAEAEIFEEARESFAPSGTEGSQATRSNISVPGETVSSTSKCSPSEIYEIACKQSVVVTTEYSYVTSGGQRMPAVVSGSGFVIDDDGHIITNYHVVEKAVSGNYPVTVSTSSGTEADAVVTGFDKDIDIAVLCADLPELEPVTLADSSKLSVGDTIYAVGDPYGVLEFSMTTGHVCALDRLVATDANENAVKMFQIDAAVYSGNSGGPVYDEYGCVAGIVTAKYEGGELDGVGFAIPANDIIESVNNIISDESEAGTFTIGKAASLGVEFDDRFTEVYSRYYRVPEGAYIRSVDSGSCAYIAGLEPGDIILEINEYRVFSSSDAEEAVGEFCAGDEAMILLYRMGEYYKTYVTFDEKES